MYAQDRRQYVARLRGANTDRELLRLLNDLKKEDCDDIYGEDYWSPNDLHRFASPWLEFRYKSFEIPKKSGGVRVISAPARTKYRLMLYYVNELLKGLYTPSESVMGFTEGRSVATNARVHIGQNYIYNIDLKDFFPSITESRIRKRLEAAPYHLSVSVAKLIAGLATMRVVELDVLDGSERVRYVLPQGSAISPILTNIICERLDKRLGGLAKRFGLRYTRYADDITFSSMHNVYQEDGDFLCELQRIISDQGFVINEKKVRLQKKGERQEVTGLVVSDKINVPQNYVRGIRNLLYIWETHGYEVAMRRFTPRYFAEKAAKGKGIPAVESVLEGKLLYLRMVKGATDSVYLRLRLKYDELCRRDLSGGSALSEKHEDLGMEDLLDALSLSLDELLA